MERRTLLKGLIAAALLPAKALAEVLAKAPAEVLAKAPARCKKCRGPLGEDNLVLKPVGDLCYRCWCLRSERLREAIKRHEFMHTPVEMKNYTARYESPEPSSDDSPVTLQPSGWVWPNWSLKD